MEVEKKIDSLDELMAKIQALKSMGSQAQAKEIEEEEEEVEEEEEQQVGSVTDKVGLPNDVNIFSNPSRGKRTLKVRIGYQWICSRILFKNK